jgi:diguanylate cyclase (GGDEF)-like protein
VAPRSDRSDLRISDEEWSVAAARTKGVVRGVIPASLTLLALVQLAASLLVVLAAPGLDGRMDVVWVGLVVMVMMTPLVFVITSIASRPTLQQFAESLARERELSEAARRRDFETGLGNALDMADSEQRVMLVARRALSSIVIDGQVEVLLADNSQAHLERALVAGAREDAGCPVESPGRCIAARRGQTQLFGDSDAIDACPYLLERPIGRCTAVCVPVSIMGRTVGVVHRVHAHPLDEVEAGATQLEMVANQLGARLGVLRLLTETQLQANTDAVTGLPNRRAFENAVRKLRYSDAPYCVVMIDLDHFKLLNDTHGHEAGDRALRMFSTMLRAELRPGDIASRYGGEEFALALPGCSASGALSTCERLREALALATQSGGSPRFTASYGVAAARDGIALDELLSNADAALYHAKRAGRDRAVLFDDSLATARDVPTRPDGTADFADMGNSV